jgi:phage/plasmid-associated DNA primase
MINQTISEMLINNFHHEINMGVMTDMLVAKILYNLFPDKYKTTFESSKSKNEIWFEFIPDKNDNMFLKYEKLSNYPVNLMKYVTDVLPRILIPFIQEMERDIKDESKDITDVQIKYIKSRVSNVKRSSVRLNNVNSWKSIRTALFTQHYDKNLYDKLEKGNEDIIGVHNGILEIKQGKPVKLIDTIVGNNYTISKTAAVKYVPLDINNKKIIEVIDILYDMFPDDEYDAMIKLMLVTSSCLSGRFKMAKIVTLLGNGSNGKSVFMELIKGVLGDNTNKQQGGYSTRTDISLLTEKKGHSQDASPTLALLEGTRLATCSEANKNDVINTGTLKSLTSNEEMIARKLFEDPKTFFVKCLIILACNFSLKLGSNDYGALRRIMVYWFKIKFTNNPKPNDKYEKKSDGNIINNIIRQKEYKEAYFSIVVLFYEYLQLKFNGDPCAFHSHTIDRETEEYINEQDIINLFINECIVLVDQKDDKKDDQRYNININLLADKFVSWSFINDISGRKKHKIDIIKDLKNSKLKKYIKGIDSDNPILINMRLIGADGIVYDNESRLFENKKNKNNEINKYNFKSGKELLMFVINEVEQLKINHRKS